MKLKLRILHLEDDPIDAELVKSILVSEGIDCDVMRVSTRTEFIAALEKDVFDLILADYSLPQFDGLSALTITQEKCPDVPFILVSGAIGEELAIEILKRGATDYVIKNKLSHLVPAVNRALREAEERNKRKRVDEALRESEKKYRNLVDNALVGIYKTNLTGDIIYVNEALCRMLEFESSKEMMVESVLKRYKNLKDREVLIEKLREKNKVDDYEVELLTKTGKIKNVLLSAIIDDNFLSGMIMDITERKQAEEILRRSESKYRVLIENLPQKIFLKDKNSVYISCNEKFAYDLKIRPDEIIGKTDYDFFPKELAEKYRADDKRIIESEKIEDMEEKYIQDGQEMFVQTVKTPVKDEKGNVSGILGIFWDITERKKMEEEIKKKVKELEEFYDMSVGRELRMVELKKEVEELKEELGKYKKDD